eukprot:GHVR01129378.1.p1 GENE.GHVR01129378.1~~GHVR01129378.1.p1  ORF type:complete len:136 (-),score=5.65 GHVR01129378.1:1054-1461(-)
MFPCLKSLDIRNCSLSETIVDVFCKKLRHLKILYISQTNLTDLMFLTISFSLNNLKYLFADRNVNLSLEAGTVVVKNIKSLIYLSMSIESRLNCEEEENKENNCKLNQIKQITYNELKKWIFLNIRKKMIFVKLI